MGSRSSVAMTRVVGGRLSSDLALLWLWLWLETVALIQPLAWELPCAVGAALKRPKKKKKRIKKEAMDFHYGPISNNRIEDYHSFAYFLLVCFKNLLIYIYQAFSSLPSFFPFLVYIRVVQGC